MSAITEYLHEMLTGSGHLRFLLQPLLAIALGILDGRRDSHKGLGPFWQTQRARAGVGRAEHLRGGLARIVIPLSLAVVFSLVFQYINRSSVHFLAALVAAFFLVALPYFVARGASCRIDLRWHRSHPRRA